MSIINSKFIKTKPFNGIIVFGRYPRVGSVKTRLGKSIGFEKAAAIYKKLLRHSLNAVKGVGASVHRYLYVADGGDVLAMKKWTKDSFSCFAQCSGDLGKRIKKAINSVIRNGASKVIVVGSDTPDISSSLLKEAIDNLDNHDLVIGPSRDGGYYLIGLKKAQDHLFEGIDWSTKSVFSQTLSKAKNKVLSVYKMRELPDIDTEFDLKIWIKEQDMKKHIFTGI
jgi:uncharacterized protein